MSTNIQNEIGTLTQSIRNKIASGEDFITDGGLSLSMIKKVAQVYWSAKTMDGNFMAEQRLEFSKDYNQDITLQDVIAICEVLSVNGHIGYSDDPIPTYGVIEVKFS
jgi:hypothetical protein